MSDPVTRLNAALAGRYHIEHELGEGGMATVYLADDLRHERKVALKVLKPELAAVVGADRFLAEIKTTANLQHPHILPLFDSGEADNSLFYVMPYVEGESLRDRLNREQQLPVSDALLIARGTAQALDFAHRQGIIHRDIKPANILLVDGEPVVADFGIALAVSAGGDGRLTETGLSLGTPHYMSPEQATGEVGVGPATDIYAMGCVLYEMLTGEPPHTGRSAQAILGKIIRAEPVSAISARRAVPANVDAAIRKALEKLPADRFTSAQEFVQALGDGAFRHGHADAEPAHATGVESWRNTAIGAASVAIVLAVGLGWSLRSLSRVEPVVPARLELNLGPGQRIAATAFGLDFALSPDGSKIIYVGESPQGGWQLWQRSLGALEPDPIQGTDGALYPAVSPDGNSVVFVDGGIKSASLLGGPAVTIEPGGGIEPTWADDGYVYFTRVGVVMRVPATGGVAERVAGGGGTGPMRHPEVLPDGRGVLVTLAQGGLAGSRIGVVDPGGGVQELFPGIMSRYAASGHIVYSTAEGALFGVSFDSKRLRTTGPAFALLDGLQYKVDLAAQFALSERGTLLYNTGQGSQSELVWVSRTGSVESVDPDWIGDHRFPSLSPDGRRVAVSNQGIDIWVKQLDRGPSLRLTFDGSQNDYPSWTPDGTAVTFFSDVGDGLSLWRKRADGSARAEPLFADERDIVEARWSPDGEWLVYRTSTLLAGAGDILAVRPGADSPPVSLVATDFNERTPAISPNGRWLAYSSNDSGDNQVYVVPFPNAGDARWSVSTAGGQEPLWAHSGRELFYRNGAGDMVAVDVETAGGFSVGQSRVLFPAGTFRSDALHHYYDVAPDDQRFIMVRPSVGEGTARLVWVQGFFDELRERASR